MDLLSRRIHDQRFLKLVREMLQAGYLEDWVYHKSHSGTPQGGIISPLLSNIVLHELDRYVGDKLIPQYTKGKCRKENPEYTKILNLKKKARKQGDRTLLKSLTKEQYTIPYGVTDDVKYRRLRYVRYADDFLLGFVGTKSEATVIKEQVGRFLLSINLQMSEEKTFITHASTGKARFLGYNIQARSNNTRLAKRSDGKKARSINGSIDLQVPPDVRTEWVRRYTQNGKSHKIGAYVQLSDYEII